MIEVVKRHWKIVSAVAVAVTFISIGIYLYNNKKATQQVAGGKGKIVLYSSSTCPHCINLKEDWEKFLSKSPVNGYDVLTVVDADEETLEQEKVQGFPTIKLYKGTGEVVEYSGNRTWESFVSFADSN